MGRVERVAPRLQGRHSTILEKNASVRQIVDNYKGEGPFEEGLGGPGPFQEEPQEFWAPLLLPLSYWRILGELDPMRLHPTSG